MRLLLERGTERAELVGDDDLIHESLCYQATFERRASELVQAFYRQEVYGANPVG